MQDLDAVLTPVIVKLGGSLLDLSDLGPRLARWLEQLPTHRILVVPGGGPTTDVIHALDRRHGLGEERSHWLALQALTLNAHLLAGILPRARVVQRLEECPGVWLEQRRPILDAHAFAQNDEGRPGCLPHSWSVTSDSVAARVAREAGARRLILLKSVDFPPDLTWQEAGQRGLVDAYFARVLEPAGREPPLDVQVINFRRSPD